LARRAGPAAQVVKAKLGFVATARAISLKPPENAMKSAQKTEKFGRSAAISLYIYVHDGP
jgi:hypothetical protein